VRRLEGKRYIRRIDDSRQPEEEEKPLHMLCASGDSAFEGYSPDRCSLVSLSGWSSWKTEKEDNSPFFLLPYVVIEAHKTLKAVVGNLTSYGVQWTEKRKWKILWVRNR